MQSTHLLLHNYTASQSHSNNTKVSKYQKTPFELKEVAKHQQVVCTLSSSSLSFLYGRLAFKPNNKELRKRSPIILRWGAIL